jgi:hypothetical protein
MARGAAEVDEEAARALNAAGWRQCSIFQPPAHYILDPRIASDRTAEWLIVCSQSCTVCSRRFHTDPVIEVAVAKPSRKFNERSPEARGSNARKLMLPIPNVPDVGAVICDINRRTYLDRKDFLAWQPEPSMQLSEKSQRTFQGWLARGYIRIAMPDNLVTRLTRKPDGLFARVRGILDSGGEEPLHLGVHAIFVDWSPNEELADERPYNFRLLLACDDEDTLRQIAEKTEDALRPFRCTAGHDGILLAGLDMETTDGITLRQSNTYTRLSDWDELSDLGDVVQDHLAAMLRAQEAPE